MKYLATQISYVLQQPEARRNLRLLGKLVLLLAVMITVWAVLFHVLMLLEGQEHTWFTGFYWALTVMTTLGFGDITFHTDLGRAFSTLVLLSGVLYLLIVMPFAFIRFFYAPWLDAQLKAAARRELPQSTAGHVIIAQYDDVAASLARRLGHLGIAHFVLESDPQRAAELHSDGVPVVAGDFDNPATFRRTRASAARLIVANLDDASNTNLTLVLREEAPDVPVVALVEDWDSVDILELSGADYVMPLKHTLGQQLALRAAIGRRETHVIGRFHDLMLAEVAVHGTPLVGQELRQTGLRQDYGVNVVGIWQRGHFVSPGPELVLGDDTVLVLLGTAEQLDELAGALTSPALQHGPTLVIGGGKVGRAAAHALVKQGIAVNLVEKNPDEAQRAARSDITVVVGDAAQRELLEEAGLAEASAVLLTTNNDAINIYLTVYCRRLNPELHIVSRITHDRNVEAIHRAGADFVLSYVGLAVRSLVAFTLGRELVLLGEGADVFYAPAPISLAGKTLASSGIGAQTGLNVVAVQRDDGEVIPAMPGTHLTRQTDLIMIGTSDQRRAFTRVYGEANRSLRPGTGAFTPLRAEP